MYEKEVREIKQSLKDLHDLIVPYVATCEAILAENERLKNEIAMLTNAPVVLEEKRERLNIDRKGNI